MNVANKNTVSGFILVCLWHVKKWNFYWKKTFCLSNETIFRRNIHLQM